MVDTANIQGGTPSDTAARDAAMAQKFQQQATPTAVDAVVNQVQGQQTPAANNQQQDLILGKFKTQADLEAAYKALESKLGAPKAPAEPAKPGEPAKPANDLSIDANAAVEQAQLNMEALTAEYAQNGSLSAENFEKLAKVGISKDMVEAFAEGQKARAAAIRADILSQSGVTEDSFSKMVDWARTSLTKTEIEAYNQATGPTVPAAMQRFALAAMHNRLIRANGTDPQFVRGERAANPGGDVYQSQEQMLVDMRKAEYRKDPAFRRAVEAKIARSPALR